MGCEKMSSCACNGAPTMGVAGATAAASGASILDRIAGAFDAAIHKGSGGGSASPALLGYPSLSRSNVIPFPMVNPYRPLLRTRVPVAGLNAFPKVNDVVNVGYRITSFNAPDSAAIAEDAGTGLAGLGDFFSSNPFISPPSQPFPQGVALPGSSGGTSSTLQSILDAISRTLPATISALKKSPYEGAYYDPSNAAQQAAVAAAAQSERYGVAPSGYSYNSSGQLVKDAVGSVTDFITENPLLVGGAVLGAVLLFMKSPSGRR